MSWPESMGEVMFKGSLFAVFGLQCNQYHFDYSLATPEHAYEWFNRHYKQKNNPFLYVHILIWDTCVRKNKLKSKQIVNVATDLTDYYNLAVQEIIKGNEDIKSVNAFIYRKSFTSSMISTFYHVSHHIFDMDLRDGAKPSNLTKLRSCLPFYDKYFICCLKSMVRLHDTYELHSVTQKITGIKLSTFFSNFLIGRACAV